MDGGEFHSGGGGRKALAAPAARDAHGIPAARKFSAKKFRAHRRDRTGFPSENARQSADRERSSHYS
jgi:hypothetical protein